MVEWKDQRLVYFNDFKFPKENVPPKILKQYYMSAAIASQSLAALKILQ